jgi:FSR family fosmidomycin resistance protein-like MFS transporter
MILYSNLINLMNEKNKILSTVSLYHGLNDGTVAAIPILFPIFYVIFNLSYTEIGIISGGGLLLSIIAQLMIGRISDGKNSQTMLSLGIFIISLSLILLAEAQGFFSLLFLMFFLRLGSSFFHPIGVGWISRIFKKDKLDWAMGIQSGSADIGAFIAISTTLYISEITSWDYPLYLWAFAGGIVLLLGVNLTRNVKKEFLIVKKISKRQTIKEAISESVIFLKKIKLLVPAFIISGSCWGIVVTYLPLLLDVRTDLSLAAIGFVVSIWIGIGSISSIYYGKICAVFGRKNVIFLSYLTIGITSILLSYFTDIKIIILIMVLLGITVFITFPAIVSFVSEITHETVEGKTFGTIFTLQLGGSTLYLFLGGFLADIFGIWIPFMLLGVTTLIFSGILLLYRKKPFVLE